MSYNEDRILRMLKKAKFVNYDYEKRLYIAKPEKGFPRLLCTIHDPELLKLSQQKNPQHYQNVETLPPPARKYFQTLNNIKVSEINPLHKNKIAFCRTIGNMNTSYKPIVYGNNKQTLFAAAKRQMKLAPLPSKEVAEDFYNYSIQLIEREVGDHLTHFHYNYSQWFNHLSADKQRLIQPIFDYYYHPEKLNQYTQLQLKEILSEAYQAIVKAELQDEDGKPRMVCSIPQIYKFAMGPITWALEEIFAKYFQGYCGNKNLTQIANDINDYKNAGFVKVVEGDGSAFDNTQDILLKAVDRYIYNRVAHNVYHIPKKDFLRIANTYYKQMKVKYRDGPILRTYITYYVLGTVFSGDCDTTLCNTIRMALYNRYINDRAGFIINKDYVVFSKGDDFSVLYKNHISDKQIQEAYWKYFLPPSDGPDKISDKREYGLGQVCKFLHIGELNNFEFCSLRSWYKNEFDDILLTRDPAKLYKLAQYSIKYKTYNIPQKIQYNIDLATSYLTNYAKIHCFTIAAAAHFKLAVTLLPQLQDKKHKRITLITQQNQGVVREHFTDTLDELPLFTKFYDTRGRETFYRIQGTYWETMKRIMMVNTQVLTNEEADYVNRQIDDEFDMQELLNQFDFKNYDDAISCIRNALKEFNLPLGLLAPKNEF